MKRLVPYNIPQNHYTHLFFFFSFVEMGLKWQSFLKDYKPKPWVRPTNDYQITHILPLTNFYFLLAGNKYYFKLNDSEPKLNSMELIKVKQRTQSSWKISPKERALWQGCKNFLMRMHESHICVNFTQPLRLSIKCGLLWSKKSIIIL